ncbi:MAG TPA: hypothetical protein PLP01_01015 [Phycisphaerae bacterium]|nr:hypothetical protein [Phycisphaerae bacterium]
MNGRATCRTAWVLAMAVLSVAVGGCGPDYQLPDLEWGPEPYTEATAADVADEWTYYDEDGKGFRLTLTADGKFVEEVFGPDGGIASRVTGTWRLEGADMKLVGWQGYTALGATPTFWLFKHPKTGQIGIFGGEGQRGSRRWTALTRVEPQAP